MRASELFQELVTVMNGTGQHLADQIDNSDRNGCFDLCNGWPETLRQESNSILVASAEIIRVGEATDDEATAILERGRNYAKRSAVVHAICRAECPGAYSLFTDDEELEDDSGEPFVKECPVKIRLANALEDDKSV